MIKIKCNYLNGAVAVPTELIDMHLKLAPAASFKVLLFILRNPDGTSNAEQIAGCTGLSISDVNMCLDFWQQNGAIEITEEIVSEEKLKEVCGNAKCCVCEEDKPSVECSKKPSVTVKSLPVKKPTQREIAKRLTEEPELEIIYKEAQGILGTFGYDTQALILMIYDYYGFPPEVIITLLQHQKGEGKTSSAAIKSRAEDWAKRGIDSLDVVEKELLALEKIALYFNELKDFAGFSGEAATPRIAKFLRVWAVDWDCSVDLIKCALEQTGNALTDTNKLLKKWVNSSIKTPQDVERLTKKSVPKEIKKSYDTETVGKSGVLDWIKKYADSEDN